MFAAIETSFDEAGIALCDGGGVVRFETLSSQVELHAPYGGCVPELAARTHLSALPQLWRNIPEELQGQISHLGVTSGPGLPGCLLAGTNFAHGVARALKVPLYGLNHLKGHVFSPFMPMGKEPPTAVLYPHMALLISGGHTELFLVEAFDKISLLGQTRDDAVGELLDKVSAMLGYGYPGGAKLEKLARTYPGLTSDGRYDGAFKLPVPMRQSGDLNFSYSGLKTAVARMALPEAGASNALAEEDHPSLLACLFSVICESLWIKVRQALRSHDVQLVTVSGGVAINGFIRAKFAAELGHVGIEVRFPQPRHCLDNAEMMAWLLKLTVDSGVEPAGFDADSNWNPGQPAIVS